MLVIRLTKIGKKHSSDYRVIVNEKRTPPKTGKYLEILGNYNPIENRLNLKKERIEYWISRGAKPSATVHNLLVKKGILKGKKIPKHKVKKETGAVVAAPASQPAKEETKKEEAKEAPKAEEKKEEGAGAPAPQLAGEETKKEEVKEEAVKADEKKEEVKPEEKKEEVKLGENEKVKTEK